MSIPTSGLICHLDFSNPSSYPGSGTAVYDLTVNGNDFAFQNTNFTYTTTYGGEVLIDSTNILKTTSPLFGFLYGTTAVSINMWMQLNTEGGSDLSMFAALNDTGGSGSHNVLFFGTQTGPTIFFNDNTDTRFQNTTFPLNTWKMITLTKPANGGSDSVKMYIDGSQINFTSGGTSTPIDLASSNSFIDSVVANLGVWSCDMTVGEYAIYDTELSSTDVTTYYNSTAARFNGIYAKYDFQDPACYSGSGSTVYDLVGNTDLDVASGNWIDGPLSFWNLQGNTVLQNVAPPAQFENNVFTVNCWYAGGFTNPSFYASVWGIGLNSPNAMPILSTQADYSLNIQWSYGYNLVPYTPSDVDWHLYTFVSTGSSTVLYVDGALIGSVASVGTIATSGGFTRLRLGCSTDAGGSAAENAYGKLGYWDYYSVGLDAGQVLDVYNATKAPYLANPYQGLKHSYDFSDPACYPGSGTSVNDLVLNADLIANNSPVFGGTGQSKYFEFNGDGSKYIYNAATVPGLGDTFSLNMWFQFDTTGAVLCPWAAGLNDGASGNAPFFSLNYVGTGRLNNGFNYGVSYAASGVLTTGTWYMATTTCNGTTNKLYIDGTEVASAAQGTGSWPSGGFIIGQNINSGGGPGGFEIMDGKVALIDVYDVTLSAGDISNIYTNESTRFGITPPPPPSYVGILGGRQFNQGFNG
jgi:hypothetical protein